MTPFPEPIRVTKPSLPPLAAFVAGLEEIWDRRWLTNAGPVLRRLERELARTHLPGAVSLFSSGAAALTIALQGLGLTGEVITSPFSFAATTNAIVQSGLTPVFADVEERHFTLDPASVEALVTPRTSAILAVHVFGHPCDVEALAAIAGRHGLALVYDAAHAFGVTVRGAPIARFGDVSMFSFHATKSFHTVEGGALAYRRAALKPIFDALANHGLGADGDVAEAGQNAKMSELQALMGTLMLPRVGDAIAHGRAVEEAYRRGLADVPGIAVIAEADPDVSPNHVFLPATIEAEAFGTTRDGVRAALLRHNVESRAYFHPLLADMGAFARFAGPDPLSAARRIAPTVLALPTYADLAVKDVARICEIIAFVQRRAAGAARPVAAMPLTLASGD